VKCPKCEAEIEAVGRFCQECGAELPSRRGPAAAGIVLDGSVAKDIEQRASGPGGAAVSLKDSVARRIQQELAGDAEAGETPSGIEALRGLAGINVKDGVVKEIRQEVHVHLGGAESVEALLGQRGAGRLKARMVYVACGREIRAYNPASRFSQSDPANVYTLPDAMGGARSVRLLKVGDSLWILAGARCGVVAFDAQSGQARVYPFPDASRAGANSATVLGEFVYATHSGLGLLRWPLGGGDATPLFLDVFRGAATVRGVHATSKGQLLLCADASVYRVSPDEPGARPVPFAAPGVKELVGAVEHGPHLYAASLDGQVLRWPADIPGRPDTTLATLGPRVYCISLAQMADGPHLVLGTKSPSVTLVKLAAPHSRAEYHTAGGVAARWARAASDLLVATDGDGMRLFFWTPIAPERPDREIVVTRSSREQVLDLCVLSQ